MPSTKPVFAAIPNTQPPRFIDHSELEGLQSAIHSRIAERAYLYFEQSGYVHGNDVNNWLRAESEVIRPGIEVRESGTWMALNASLPQVAPENVQIFVEKSRVIVRAEKMKQAAKKEDDTRAADGEEFFLVADLKAEADPATASASLKNHKLTLMIQKRSPENSQS